MTDPLEDDGYRIARGVLSAAECAELIASLGAVDGAGRRGLLSDPVVRCLARSATIQGLIRPHLGGTPRAVRAIFFDKSPAANWLVPWHQDLTIAVRARAEAPGFGPWSVKQGVPHVQAPPELLARMLTVRLHLDDADASSGALRVIAGSHRAGRIAGDRIAAWRKRGEERLCPAQAGDAMLMRPLLLHASGKSVVPRHRRVLHLEFAAFDLPPGLSWHETA